MLDTNEFIAEVRRWAGTFNKSLCSGGTIDSIVNQLQKASDIMRDGSPGTPSETCNGISVGLGFEATRAELGVSIPAQMPPHPCQP